MFKVILLALLCVSMTKCDDFAFRKFQEFMHKYEKVYSSPEELSLRFNNFRNNLLEIVAEDDFSSSHVKGINKFSDMSFAEFKQTYLNLKKPATNQYCYSSLTKNLNAPTEVDWRTQGKVSPVKNQASCGSCWAFSIVGYLESQALIQGKTNTYSEQQLVDCNSTTYGCNGGWPQLAMQYLEQAGIESDKSYPYTGRDGTCVYDKSKVVSSVANTKCYENITDAEIQGHVANVGPLSIVLDANDFFSYSSGILQCTEGTEMNHAVLLVGYTQNSWIVKNSWGKNWGENGFVRISNQAGKNCGVGTYIVTADLK